jgi:formylmethanofuran dehydrogenase subunit E-like metal-binding protein
MATLIGSICGFIFSIVLFHYNKKWTNEDVRKALEKNLAREFEFNIKFLNRQLEDVKKIIEKITVGDRDTTKFYFRYSNFQRMFIASYFQQGYLYEKLTPEDINVIDAILSHLSNAGENYINSIVVKWQTSEINQIEALKIFCSERELIESHIKSITIGKSLLTSA